MNQAYSLYFQDYGTLRAIFDERPNPHHFEFLGDFDNQLPNGIQFEVPSWSFAADTETGEVQTYYVTYSDPVVYPSGAIGGCLKCTCPDAVCRRRNGEVLGCSHCKHGRYVDQHFMPAILYHLVTLAIWGDDHGYQAA